MLRVVRMGFGCIMKVPAGKMEDQIPLRGNAPLVSPQPAFGLPHPQGTHCYSILHNSPVCSVLVPGRSTGCMSCASSGSSGSCFGSFTGGGATSCAPGSPAGCGLRLLALERGLGGGSASPTAC